jgi:hypothetical protein
MSAFFDWDIEPVKQALLKEIKQAGYPRKSRESLLVEEGSEWNRIVIDLKGFDEKEFYTDTWDVEFCGEELMDGSLVYTIRAHAIYEDEDGEDEAEGSYSAWIVLHQEDILGEQSE